MKPINAMEYTESFQRKAYGLNGFDTIVSHFSTELWVFAFIFCGAHSHKNYFDVLLMTC